MDSYQSLEWKLKRLLGRYRVQMPWRHLNWMSLVDESELSGLFEGPLPPTKTGWANLFDLHHIQENLNDMLYLDRVNYMPGEVLTKVDTASMAHSLEVRPPFLDNDLAAWCDQLPIDWKVHGTQGKWLLKESYRGLIPDDILFRPKHGFSVPLAQWMMGPLVKWCHEALADRSFFAQTGLRRQSFQQRFDRHARGLNDCARELWALIVLQRWGRQSGVIC
jgi:asparagine synthase (glutamine-hydrolysing)